MTISKRPVVAFRDQNQLRRDRESINGILDHSFDDSRRQTDAEKLEGATPVNKAFPPGDVRRWGAVGDGVTNDAPAIQRAIDVAEVYGGEVYLPSPKGQSYYIGNTTLEVGNNVFLVGDANEMVKVTYDGGSGDGSGYAVEFTGYSNGARNLQFIVRHLNASGLRFAGPSQASGLQNVKIENSATPSTDRLGAGILFLANSTDGGFSGGFYGEQVYVVGFKYGHRYVGFSSAVETWTCVTFSQAFIVGRAGGPISGSKGIWFDSETNGVGTVYTGGTCEFHEVGIQVDNGTSCIGLFFRGDLEGNTTNWSLGASFNGFIEAHNSGNFISCGANDTVNRWYQRQQLNGQFTDEHYYGPRIMVYDHGGEAARWELFRGPASASFISGTGAGVSKFAIQMDDSTDSDGDTNWIEFLGTHKTTWRSSTPAVGTWAQGNVVWNTNAAAGGSPGWVVTSSGTFSAFTDNTGDTDGSTATITGMTSTSGLAVGQYVSVSAGFPATGPYRVIALTSTSITVDTNSNSAQSNVTVSTPDPVFKAMANLAP